METFEIHITGSKSILQNNLGLKTISVELLKPDRTPIRVEYMTSHVQKFKDFNLCRRYVGRIEKALKKKNVQIIRSKIECPLYEHYINQSLYIESHFLAFYNSKDYPLSRNLTKEYLLATDREYDKANYNEFMNKYKNETLELCLYDSFIGEDKDWFDLYK